MALPDWPKTLLDALITWEFTIDKSPHARRAWHTDEGILVLYRPATYRPGTPWLVATNTGEVDHDVAYLVSGEAVLTYLRGFVPPWDAPPSGWPFPHPLNWAHDEVQI